MSTAVARPMPGGRSIAGRLRGLVPVLAVLVIGLLLWEVVLGVLGVKQFLLPRPSVIFASLISEWGTLLEGLRYTAIEAVGGLAMGSVIALGTALATARWVLARETLVPVAIAANSMPIIAFAPITNNWFGSENAASRMTIVAVMVFFPIMVNTVRGLTNVDPSALELMRSYAASDWEVLRRVRIPNALPYILTAFRIATTLAVIGAVIGEFVGSLNGLGNLLLTANSQLDSPLAWAALVWLSVLGIVLFAAVVVVERLVMPWSEAGHH